MKKFISVTLAIFLSLSCLFLFSCGQEEKIDCYQIECVLDGNKLVGKQKFTFYNDTDNSFSNLKFNLFANAFRKDAKYSPISAQYSQRAYYNGESYGDMQISRVYDSKGDLAFEICGEDQNILQVNLTSEIFPEESKTIFIEYSITLAT